MFALNHRRTGEDRDASCRAAPLPARSSFRKRPSRCPRTGAGRRRARPHGGSHQGDGNMDEQEGPWPDQPHPDRRQRGEAEVRAHGADPGPGALTGEAARKAVLNQEEVGRSDAEHHEGMPVDAVLEAAPPAPILVFAHRQGVDVADAPGVEVADARMVDRVAAAPVVVGRLGEDAEQPPGPVIRPSPWKERAVPAVVLDHEQPHQERGRQRQEHGVEKHPAVGEGRSHQRPPGGERDECDQEFEHGPAPVGLPVGAEAAHPVGFGRRPLRHGGGLID